MTRNFKTLLLTTALLATTITLGLCSASGARLESSATKNVTVGDNFFSRSSTTINRNDSVKFRWDNTSKRHNVNVRSGPVKFKSRTKKGVYSYTRKFTTTGTYKLNCTIHPDSMRTTVKVK